MSPVEFSEYTLKHGLMHTYIPSLANKRIAVLVLSKINTSQSFAIYNKQFEHFELFESFEALQSYASDLNFRFDDFLDYFLEYPSLRIARIIEKNPEILNDLSGSLEVFSIKSIQNNEFDFNIVEDAINATIDNDIYYEYPRDKYILPLLIFTFQYFKSLGLQPELTCEKPQWRHPGYYYPSVFISLADGRKTDPFFGMQKNLFKNTSSFKPYNDGSFSMDNYLFDSGFR